MPQQPKSLLTPRQYLTLERRADYKREYYNGEIIPRLPCSLNHVSITVALICRLHPVMGCKVFGSDLRIHVPAENAFVYPDLSVVCGAVQLLDGEEDVLLLNPVLVVEVLSPATEGFDRGRKFEIYRSIPSLREYLLLSQGQPRAEVWRKNDAGIWELHLPEDDVIELASVNCSLRLDDVYADVEMGEGRGLR
jgi:Uma2 family endonuclease